MKKLDKYLVEDLNANMGYYFNAGEKIFEKKTPYQNLEVYDFPDFGKVLRLDGIFQTSERDEFLYHEPLVHVPGVTMGGPKTALVIGGGDGGTIEEILKYKTIERVVMIELDRDVVEASQKYIPSISNGAFDSEKLDLKFEDGIAFIKNTNEKFDLVVVDLTDPFGPSMDLYTQDFYISIDRILTEKSALTLHIESPIVTPDIFNRLHSTLKSIFKVVRPMTNYVPLYGTLWGFAMASQTLDPLDVPKEKIENEIQKLHQLQFYNADTHKSLLSLPNYIQEILEDVTPPITRENPIEAHKQLNHSMHLCEE